MSDKCRRPTFRVWAKALWLYVMARRRLKVAVPRGTFSEDCDGGLRIEWLVDDRKVSLCVPSRRAASVYWENHVSYWVRLDPTVRCLMHRLCWMTSAGSDTTPATDSRGPTEACAAVPMLNSGGGTLVLNPDLVESPKVVRHRTWNGRGVVGRLWR